MLSGPELLLRYGLHRRLELRLGLPDYGRAVAAGKGVSGVGDTYLGAKLSLGALPAVGAIALVPAFSLPLGGGARSSRSVDPEVKLVSARSLGAIGDLSLMSYALWTTGDDGRYVAFQQTASFGHDLTERVGLFVEYAGNFSRVASADHVAHTGLAFALGPRAQVDVHGGLSMNGPDRQPFIGVGFAARY